MTGEQFHQEGDALLVMLEDLFCLFSKPHQMSYDVDGRIGHLAAGGEVGEQLEYVDKSKYAYLLRLGLL